MQRSEAASLPDWIKTMLPQGIERYRVDVGGHFMHVMELGRGRPVLMLHGNPTWGFLYRKVASALMGEPLRLIMPDLIGLGLSDKPGGAVHRLNNHARWIGRLIDGLDLRDLILVCQDWGGAIGVRALADRPRRASGLVLLNTVVTPPKKNFRPTAFHRFARLPVVSQAAFRLGGFPQNTLWPAQGDHNSIRGDVARAYRFVLRGLRNNAAPLALARMVPDSHQHPSIEPLTRCQEFIESFDGRSAIVWGDRDPVLGNVRTWMEKLLPNAEVTRTQAGHFLQEEVPDEIAGAIVSMASSLSRN